MKIQALIRFADQDRYFTIPCGTGKKSFKWLGNVASQRFSNAAPNGSLRRREQLYSGSDVAQYQVKSMRTPLGEMPNPSEFIQDYLQDGDELLIELADMLAVSGISSSAMPSSWTANAYSISQSHLMADLGGLSLDADDEGDNSETESMGGSESNFSMENYPKSASHINFVKLMLKSQQVDVRMVEQEVEVHWPVVERALPKLNKHHIPVIRGTFIDYWDLLKDVFNSYTDKEHMLTKDNFLAFIEDSCAFPQVHAHARGNLIFQRTCTHANATASTFNFDSFLISLLFAAQLKYNDTLDPRVSVNTAYDAVESIIADHLVPLAHRLDCLSVLKSAFFSDECLIKVRYHYETLQDVFGRSAAKLRDVPSTISAAEFNDLLYHAGLTDSVHEVDRCRKLLVEVCQGSIYGRGVDAVEEKSHADFEFDCPVTEFTFAEFVEAVARAAYHQHMKALSKGTDESQESMTTNGIVEQMVRGVVAMADYGSGKNVRAASKNKQSRQQQQQQHRRKSRGQA